MATLRLSAPNAPQVGSPGPQPGGRFEVRNFPLGLLIRLGWDVSLSDLKACLPWLNSARVDLTAKLPSTESTREIAGVVDMGAFQPALKALLIERFKVAIHTEQQPVPGYALVAAKPKMQKADPATRTKCMEGPGANGKDPENREPASVEGNHMSKHDHAGVCEGTSSSFRRVRSWRGAGCHRDRGRL